MKMMTKVYETNEDQKWIQCNNTEDRTSTIGRIKKHIIANLMLILTLLGVIIGFALGFSIQPLAPSRDALMWIGMPGELFMRALQMMILPLVVCSVIAGTAGLDPQSNGKITTIALMYIYLTNAVCAPLGLMLALIIKPDVQSLDPHPSPPPPPSIPSEGTGGVEVDETVTAQKFETQDIFADLLRNLVPSNIIEACFRQTQTKYEKLKNSTNITGNAGLTVTKTIGTAHGPNVLGLIVVCLLLGISTNRAGEKGKPFVVFFQSATEVILIVLRWFLWLTPIGVASLITVSVAEVEDPIEILRKTGLFVLTVIIGQIIHQVILMPTVLFVSTRRNPLKFFVDILRPWLISFATTATAAALPEMFHACENKQKIDEKVSRFTLPLCTTMNAEGSVIYVVVAAVFLAQLDGFNLTIGDYFVLVILSSIAGMSIPSVPSASIVVLLVVVTSLNIPSDGIALLFSVEWLLDRIRTSSNLFSHMVCAVLTYQLCKDSLGCDQPSEEIKENDATEITKDLSDKK